MVICIPCLIFILDDFFKSDYEDPFRVAKAFSYSYMTKNTKNMKSWAYKEVYEKIDNLQYSTPVDDRFSNYSDFELVCFQRLGNTIVSTYGQNIILPVELPLFYSVVLELVGSDSLWERVTEFIYFEVPLGRNICSFPRSKDRWLVVDFFTNDDYGQYTIDLMEKYDNEWFPFDEIEVSINVENRGNADNDRVNSLLASRSYNS